MTYAQIKALHPFSKRYGECPRCGGAYRPTAKMCRSCWNVELKQPTTRRQIQVFKLFIEMQGNMKAVADNLGLSLKTIEYHLTGLKHRLGLRTYVELVCWGFRKKIIE